MYINEWLKFCSYNSIDPDSADIESGIEFITYLFKSNLGYSAIKTARSALSTMVMDVNNVPFGQHVLVKRLMKSIFQLRPALPKYSKTWNNQTVLDYLNAIGFILYNIIKIAYSSFSYAFMPAD